MGALALLALASPLTAQNLLTIEARDDKPGPVEALVEARDATGGVLDSTTIFWDADDDGWRSLPVGGFALPTGTTTVRVTYKNDFGPRDLFIDFISVDGNVCDGPDFRADGGPDPSFPGANETILDGRSVADLGNQDDWVEYTVAPLLSIEARDDKPGPVEALVEAKDSGGAVLASSTILWDADDNGWRSLPAGGMTLPIGTARVRVTFKNDSFTPGDPDLDRNLFIDTYEVSGFTHEAEDYCVDGGAGVGVVDGRTVADLGNQNDYVEYELALAKQTIRLGSPANPFGFRRGDTPPIIGETWDPLVTTFQSGAILAVVAVSGGPTNIPLGGPGTLLCDPTLAPLAVLGAPGVNFAIPIPEVCIFVGQGLCTQGVSVDAFGAFAFANALDIVIGSH